MQTAQDSVKVDSDIKHFLLLLWKNRWIFISCLMLGLFGVLFYMYVIIKPMYESSATINIGYITNERGEKQNLTSAQEVSQEIEDVFIESRKYLTSEQRKELQGIVKEVDASIKNPNLPFVKVVARGKTQEDVQNILNQVLEYVQEKNKSKVESQNVNINAFITNIDARINNIQNSTLPYLDAKILRAEDDIKELKKELKKESLSPTQYQTLSNYLGQLQISIDSTENTKATLQNQTLTELDQQKVKYALMLGEGSLKNASFVTINITPEPDIGVKRWVVLFLGVLSGVVLGALIVSGKELFLELRKQDFKEE